MKFNLNKIKTFKTYKELEQEYDRLLDRLLENISDADDYQIFDNGVIMLFKDMQPVLVVAQTEEWRDTDPEYVDENG